MSPVAFGELARALAQPISRRRVMRLFGGAVVVAAVPGLRPRLARAGRSTISPRVFNTSCGDKTGPVVPCSKGTTCGFETTDRNGYVTCNKGCCQNTGDPAADLSNAVCCNQDKRGSWCCAKGFTCGSGDNTAADPNCRCHGIVRSDDVLPEAEQVHEGAPLDARRSHRKLALGLLPARTAGAGGRDPPLRDQRLLRARTDLARGQARGRQRDPGGVLRRGQDLRLRRQDHVLPDRAVVHRGHDLQMSVVHG